MVALLLIALLAPPVASPVSQLALPADTPGVVVPPDFAAEFAAAEGAQGLRGHAHRDRTRHRRGGLVEGAERGHAGPGHRAERPAAALPAPGGAPPHIGVPAYVRAGR
ncbi:MAG: hypothetical protein R3F43_30080 [bacterium]